MLLYHDIAGNAYVVRRGDRLTCLRPDWMTLVGGVPGNGEASVWHPDAEVLGYVYKEGGPGSGKEPIVLMPNQVAHFAARPDPETRFTGMSWITPVVREVMGDKAATEHKLKFFENGATPNLAVKLDVQDLEVFKNWIQQFKQDHEGVDNAYKTMFLAAGADVTSIGTDLQQLEFKVTQGAGETRIAAAAGVPPVVAGFSEGLAAATYSNYAQARRRFADQTIRPLWRNVCGSLQMVVTTPPDAQLWYDDKDVSALQEDQKDAAEIMQGRATAIKTFVDAGYDPDSARKAVAADDLSLLVHTGLVSVQLQPPGSTAPDGGDGSGAGDPAPDQTGDAQS
jgi:HK97 family phage portal protein